MEDLNVPSCLRHAGEEMFLAISSLSPEEEAEHEARAREMTVRAVQSIQRDPKRKHDWDLLKR